MYCLVAICGESNAMEEVPDVSFLPCIISFTIYLGPRPHSDALYENEDENENENEHRHANTDAITIRSIRVYIWST